MDFKKIHIFAVVFVAFMFVPHNLLAETMAPAGKSYLDPRPVKAVNSPEKSPEKKDVEEVTNKATWVVKSIDYSNQFRRGPLSQPTEAPTHTNRK